MTQLDRFLSDRSSEILSMWATEAQHTASARGLSAPELTNVMPRLLRSLAQGGPVTDAYIERHLASRLRQGYAVAEAAEEFHLLGRCLADVWSRYHEGERPSPQVLSVALTQLTHAAAVAADLFAAHLLQDEQTEKRYLRLLEQLATTSLQERAASLSELLSEALAIVADAVSADGALLVLHDPRTNAPAMTAAAGIARGITLNEATELASIECLISSHEAPLPDAATQIDLPGAVRAHGIESALGVSMPVRHRVTGVLYACMKDRRALDARDVRRLDVMGDALSLHVDNAQLVTELRHAVDALNTERTVRERFVAVLAHDLRGPLSTAMLNMTALSHDADPAKARAAHRIVRSLRRAARMVENLLDANRLHAGEPLALHKQPCDLVALTHEVLRDLTDAHGARFLVTADEGHVEGTWDADYLQRALWNLCVNAVQYGARERPIRVRIHASKDTVDLSVHNEGSFIAEEDRERLFEPYARGPADAAAARGWGLGLSLVRGCAVAHGGRVDLASSRADGTTFTMELPREPTDGRHDSVTAPPLQLASSYVAVR